MFFLAVQVKFHLDKICVMMETIVKDSLNKAGYSTVLFANPFSGLCHHLLSDFGDLDFTEQNLFVDGMM